MSANGGANCQVPSVRIKPWFYLQYHAFGNITKTPMHRPKNVGFFPPLLIPLNPNYELYS